MVRSTEYGLRTTNIGLTLFELIVTFLLTTIMLGAMWAVYSTGLKTFYNQFTRSGIKEEVTRLNVNISTEIRQANSITTADQTNLVFTIDSDDDGADENIQYTWSGTDGDPLNRVTAVTVPVVNSVNSLSFSYYDANNNLLNSPVTVANVRLVAIDITTKDRDETFRLVSKARLRNL